VDEAPAARRPHLDLLAAAADSLAPGSRVLDVGSGDAPYRELFSRHTYVTSDWEGTQYAPEHAPDLIGPAHDLPVDASSFDGVICTQVLEHVADPASALAEFHRVLRPGGMLCVSTPLTWYLHETPNDFYRYTSYGLAHLVGSAGFVDLDIRPMNSTPTTIAQLLRHLGYLLGRVEDGHNPRRVMAGEVSERLADVIDTFGDLDTQWWLPISYSVVASKPAAP
jgi:SAM-dependent methyltransferase